MGYRSDVSVVFYTRHPSTLPYAAIKLWFDENYPRKEATEDWGAEVQTGDDYVLVTYQDVKWYAGYKHPDAVRACLDAFEECFDTADKDEAAWEMVVMGEEPNDVGEERSNYCDYRLCVRREIEFC